MFLSTPIINIRLHMNVGHHCKGFIACRVIRKYLILLEIIKYPDLARVIVMINRNMHGKADAIAHASLTSLCHIMDISYLPDACSCWRERRRRLNLFRCFIEQ